MMLIGWARVSGLSIQATLAVALLAFALLPEIANAHSNSDLTNITLENPIGVDTGLANEPSFASSHCHSNFGQDCSTQIAFLIPYDILANATSFDVTVPIYNTLSTDWLLSFDPPPPRVQS